jgi:crcB protein
LQYLLVGFGGALGAASRYLLGDIITRKSNSVFPFGTLIINVLGALLLGVLVGFNAGTNTYLLLGEGFLGAFTTFSTFMYESLNLSQTRKFRAAVLYIAGSIFLGTMCFVLGFEIVIMLK